MIVYHGSTEAIKNPDVIHSKKYLDFGREFYVTTFENQAKKWAIRKGMRQEKSAVVNVYKLSENWNDFKVLSFEKENEKWLDFVCESRKGSLLNQEYDIVIGNVADDNVFKTVNDLPESEIEFDVAIDSEFNVREASAARVRPHNHSF